MFSLAILIGIYSYFIFALGLLGFFYKSTIILLSFFYLLLVLIYYRKKLKFRKIFQYFEVLEQLFKTEKFVILILPILALQISINFVGALGPELGFDALWYHLTLPKIYLENHEVLFVPGGLLYYSAIPKLIEMLYIPVLSFGDEIFAKLVHFAFGLLSCLALYRLSRIFLDVKWSLLTVLVFYSNLVVAWQSTTAYIDLGRTFFEIMALWGFVMWVESREKKWLIESAVMVGLAISTKLLALGSLFTLTLLLVYAFYQEGKKNIKQLITNILVFWWLALLIPLPWFIFSFVHTGSPIYPFFSEIYKVALDLSFINPVKFISDTLNLFTASSDPISPIYIIILPLLVWYHKRLNGKEKTVLFYCILALLVWYFTPRTGGGRFILPYLPAFSLLSIMILQKNKAIQSFLILIIFIIAIITIGYRAIANSRYVPVILGKETKSQFLAKNLNFSFGDFHDTDDYFKKNIAGEDRVLLFGFHNLYYVDFQHVDSSWVKKGDKFNYIATQNTELPKRFKYWNLVYMNSKTGVNLYSMGGQMWVY